MRNDIGALQQGIQEAIWSRGRIGNYEIVRKIGEGSFSSVFLAIHVMTRHEVVLKSADKLQANLAAEISNMSLLSHPHIVRLYEYIVMPDKVWLVLEYCGGEELLTHLVSAKVIPPARACRFFAQLAGAVAYAHQLHCAHRDLKLENVLLDNEGNIKLADFGFTRSYVPRTMLETVCGTESYMAPELLLHQRYNPEAADVWSLGVILYAMLYGKLPFDEDNTSETVKQIVENDPPFPSVPRGEFLVEIARKMLRKQPGQRPRVVDMLDELKEPGRQQKQLLVKISNHPESSYIFSSKEERTVLKGMKALSIDLHHMASSIVNHKCNPLHGLWYTALDRHRALAKQAAAEPSLSRRKSKTSIRSSKSQSHKTRPNGLRHEPWGEHAADSTAETSFRHDEDEEDETRHLGVAESSLPQASATSQHTPRTHSSLLRAKQASLLLRTPTRQTSALHQPSQQSPQHSPLRKNSNFSVRDPPHQPPSLLEPELTLAPPSPPPPPQAPPAQPQAPARSSSPSRAESQSHLHFQVQATTAASTAKAKPATTVSAPSKEKKSHINQFIQSRTTGKSRRAMEKLISALKLKRQNGKETLLAYYKPNTEAGSSRREAPSAKLLVNPPSSDGEANAPQSESPSLLHSQQEDQASERLDNSSNSPHLGQQSQLPRSQHPPTSSDRAPRSLTVNTAQTHTFSLVPTHRGGTSLAESGRSSPPASFRHSTLSVASSTSLTFSESPVKHSAAGGAGGAGSLYETGESNSATSLTAQPPPALQTASSQSGKTAQGPSTLQAAASNMSRQISTYSQISQVSQLSQSSIEASQLLQEASESPTSHGNNSGSFSGGLRNDLHSNNNTVGTGSGSNQNSTLQFAASRWASNSGWRSWGPSASPGSGSTPPGTPLISRPRANRLITVKESLPGAIDEGDSEGEVF